MFSWILDPALQPVRAIVVSLSRPAAVANSLTCCWVCRPLRVLCEHGQSRLITGTWFPSVADPECRPSLPQFMYKHVEWHNLVCIWLREWSTGETCVFRTSLNCLYFLTIYIILPPLNRGYWSRRIMGYL